MIGITKTKPALKVHKEEFYFDDSEWYGEFSMENGDALKMTGGVEEREEESLWGDQVSSIHIIEYAQADMLYSVEQYDEDDNLLPYVNIGFLQSALWEADETENEIDVIHCRVSNENHLYL